MQHHLFCKSSQMEVGWLAGSPGQAATGLGFDKDVQPAECMQVVWETRWLQDGAVLCFLTWGPPSYMAARAVSLLLPLFLSQP